MSALRALSAYLAENWAKVVGYALVPLAALTTAWVAENPWPLAWLLAPVVLLESVPAWRWLRAEPDADKPLALGRAMGWTLGGFALLYLVVAGTSVCASPAPLPGCEDDVLPRNWLRTATLTKGLPRTGAGGWLRDALSGDWRYAIADQAPRSNELVVVLLDGTSGGRENRRMTLVTLIGFAHSKGARGIAFDFFLEGEMAVDRNLVAAINTVRPDPNAPQAMQVFFGTKSEVIDGVMSRKPMPPATLVDSSVRRDGRGPLREADEGHLYAYSEADELIRSVPLGSGHQTGIPPLSLRVASHLSKVRGDTGSTQSLIKDLETTRGTALFQFPAPSDGVHTLRFSQLSTTMDLDPLFNRRFVLVGLTAPEDPADTPFSDDQIPGVVVHAYAVEALGRGARILHVPWWVSVLGLLYPCLSIAGRAVRGDRARRLVFSALAVSALFVGIAALAMHLDLLWISTLEGLVGLWLFLPLALLVRKRAKPPRRFRPVLAE